MTLAALGLKILASVWLLQVDKQMDLTFGTNTKIGPRILLSLAFLTISVKGS